MTKLLCILFALSLTTVIQAGSIPDEFKEIAAGLRETCVKESGVDPELIETIIGGTYVDDQKLKCYGKCIFDQFRLLSDDGFNFDAMLTLAPATHREPVAHVIKECRNTTWKKGDLCDLAANFMLCAAKAEPDRYFII